MNASNTKTGGAYIKEVCEGTLIFCLDFFLKCGPQQKVNLDVKHGFNLKALNVNIPYLGLSLAAFCDIVL